MSRNTSDSWLTFHISLAKYFEKQCLLEYVGNNNTDWSDEKIEFVTERAFDILKEVDNSDNEHYAIDSAVEEWEVFKHGKKIRN